jgi:hypothetical protein
MPLDSPPHTPNNNFRRSIEAQEFLNRQFGVFLHRPYSICVPDQVVRTTGYETCGGFVAREQHLTASSHQLHIRQIISLIRGTDNATNEIGLGIRSCSTYQISE